MTAIDQSKAIVFLDLEGNQHVIYLPRPEDCALSIEDIAAKDVPAGLGYEIKSIADIVFPEDPPPAALDTPPVQIACVLHAITEGGDISAFGGSYRFAAMWMTDVGTVLTIFTQHLGDAEPFAISNNGVSISIAEWGGDYAIIEIRDHAGGSLITPSHFGFSLYSL
ncbi:hypothetical protein ABCW43_02255 [Neorhizobium sp. IRAMC:178]|uniref:hypothetical protein n=1 Tax=Neorhizobium tunisiense TaxID=3144793 RepID=UPI0031F6DF58